MERTDEAIYYRAAEEHIRQPDPYEDDDEVKVIISAESNEVLFGQTVRK